MTIIFPNRLASFWTGISRCLIDTHCRRFSSNRVAGAPAFGIIPTLENVASIALRDRDGVPSPVPLTFRGGETPMAEEFPVALEDSPGDNAVEGFRNTLSV